MARNSVLIDGDIQRIERRQRVAKRLKELEDEYGHLTPQVVVEDAKNPASPLHDSFNWNVAEAAEKFWLMQARSLIRSVRYVFSTEMTVVQIPQYLRDPSANGHAQGYTSIPKLLTEPEQARRALASELDRARSILVRTVGYGVALGLIAELQQVLQSLENLLARVTPPEAPASG